MVYQELQTYAISESPEIILCYVNDVTAGLFMSMFFLAVWMIMTFGSFYMTKKATGSGDFPVSMTLGSFTTFVVSIFFRLLTTCTNYPLTSDVNLGVIIGLTFLSAIFLFNSKD